MLFSMFLVKNINKNKWSSNRQKFKNAQLQFQNPGSYKISGKAVPDDRISLQAETPHASRNSDGHAAIFDKKLFIVSSFHEETCEETCKWTSERSGARGRSN